MDRYSNNFSDSSQNDFSGGSWVYINGELYHAGVKGMHWYQHLPSTDWWRRSNLAYYKSNGIYNKKPEKSYDTQGKVEYKNYPKPTLGQRVAANLNTVGRYLKGEASYYGNKARTKIRGTRAYQSASKFASQVSGQLSDFARNAWQEARGKTQAVFKSFKGQEKIDRNASVNSTFLDAFQSSQYGDALRNYTDGKSKGSVGNTINQFIQNAQYGIVKGINNYLKQMKMDDDVDRFLAKLSGGKSRTYANRYVKDNKVSKPSGPYNGDQQRVEQRRDNAYESPAERQRRIQQNRVR